MKRKRSPTLPGGELSPPKAPQEKASPVLLEAIEANRPKIVRWLVGLGLPKGDAPDVAQEVITAAWQAGHQYDAARGVLVAWLRGIAKKHAWDYRDARVRLERLNDPLWSEVMASSATPEEKAAAAEQLRRADRLLSQLTAERAEVLVRHDYAGEGMKDIAASLGIPVATGYSRLLAARADMVQAILRDEAKQQGAKPTTERKSKRHRRSS